MQVKARGCVGKNADGRYRLYGKWEFCFASGMKQAEGEYQDALEGGERGDTGLLMDGREGHWVLWHENGQKQAEGTYRDGKQDGLAVLWHENGRQSEQAVYNFGELVPLTHKMWDEQGNRIK